MNGLLLFALVVGLLAVAALVVRHWMRATLRAHLVAWLKAQADAARRRQWHALMAARAERLQQAEHLQAKRNLEGPGT